MTVALTQDALKKLAEAFGSNSTKYNIFVSAAAKSPFFAGELNAFAALKIWNFQNGEAGSGVFTNPNEHFISLDVAWNESPDVFATTLAHELGHTLLKGGTGGIANDPLEAKANGRTNSTPTAVRSPSCSGLRVK